MDVLHEHWEQYNEHKLQAYNAFVSLLVSLVGVIKVPSKVLQFCALHNQSID